MLIALFTCAVNHEINMNKGLFFVFFHTVFEPNAVQVVVDMLTPFVD